MPQWIFWETDRVRNIPLHLEYFSGFSVLANEGIA